MGCCYSTQRPSNQAPTASDSGGEKEPERKKTVTYAKDFIRIEKPTESRPTVRLVLAADSRRRSCYFSYPFMIDVGHPLFSYRVRGC